MGSRMRLFSRIEPKLDASRNTMGQEESAKTGAMRLGGELGIGLHMQRGSAGMFGRDGEPEAAVLSHRAETRCKP